MSKAFRQTDQTTAMPPRELLLIAGTRPEALKLAPLAQAWHSQLGWVWTGQQAEPPPEASHWPWQRVPPPTHPLRRACLLAVLEACLQAHLRLRRPRAVIVQGDTASALAGARAARALGLSVVHLEAGLRSGDLRAPFPEEAYRREITRLADLHLAPSLRAVAQLRSEGVADAAIVQVGSTAVDALRLPSAASSLPGLDLLIDVHRRENVGRPLLRLAQALRALARMGWRIGLAAHPNVEWAQRWDGALGPNSGVRRLPLLERAGWLGLARGSRGVLSDSGGAAEELPYLGVPLLVYRRRVERPEALETRHARLLPPQQPGVLEDRIERALAAPWPAPWPLAPDSPYGDGHAGVRAAQAIENWLAVQDPPREARA